MSDRKISVGGQAVIEGVMMRSPTIYATAVRTPQGRIVIQKIRFVALTHKFKFLNIPIVRGAINLVETMWLGIQSLSYSASQAMEEDKPKQEKSRRFLRIPVIGSFLSSTLSSIVSAVETFTESKLFANLSILGSIVFAFGMGFLLFFLIPLWLTELMPIANGIAFNLVDGVIRLIIFLAYILAIAQWKEVQRIFQYHGAEHKTIYAFEAGQDLTVENARPYTTLHPRCGTSFLIVVMLVSILVFSFFGRPDTWGDRLLRFAMIPVIGGISFEFIKLSAKEKFARYLKPAIWPGLTLQKVTTKEPTDDMLEVAIAALDACLDYQSVKLELPAS